METLRSLVKEAREAGHKVVYRTRKDGSIRIVSFDGIRFRRSSSEGNNLLRSVMGSPLTERRKGQLERASKYIPKSIREEVRKINEVVAKKVEGGGNFPKIDIAQVKRVIKEGGYKITKEKLKEYLDRVNRYVPPSQVRNLYEQVNNAINTAMKYGVPPEYLDKLTKELDRIYNSGFYGSMNDFKTATYTGFTEDILMMAQMAKRFGRFDDDTIDEIIERADELANKLANFK